MILLIPKTFLGKTYVVKVYKPSELVALIVDAEDNGLLACHTRGD